jgi:2-polyprenyl-6-methoxyphenol hydroxylase-like FAD-dependent oxidoreductase
MGVLPRIRLEALNERGLAFLKTNGKVAATMPADAFGGEGIVAEIEILRGDLSRILIEASGGSVEYVFGESIAALNESSSNVSVQFESGEKRDYDIVVGADGAHSAVRAFAFGPDRDFVKHLGGYTAYFSVPDPGDLDGWFVLYNAPGGRVAGLRPAHGGAAQAALTFTSQTTSYDAIGSRQQKELLASALEDVGWRVPALLDSMSEASDFYFGSVCQVVVDCWSRGRTVLLGDAAFCSSPLTGLGTSMALVGAYVLAGELAASPHDPAAAFGRYQDEMRTYVAECQELPPGGMNGFAPKSRAMIGMRNLSMRLMTAWPVRNLLAKQFQKSDGITLKDYSRPAVSRP